MFQVSVNGGIRQLPMRANIKPRDQDRAGRWWFKKNQSRRDLTKVAQYEVLGYRFQKAIRPERDDRWVLTIVEPRARPKADRFYRPARDGRVFLLHSQHFVLGHFH